MFRDIGNGAEEEDGADISDEDLRSYFQYQFLKPSFIFRDTFKKVDVDNSGEINMQVRDLIEHLMQAIIRKAYGISNFNRYCLIFSNLTGIEKCCGILGHLVRA